MQVYIVLCAFQLLHCYAISAHPTLYPKTLEKRGVEGAAVDAQLHHLHKRMEESSAERARKLEQQFAATQAKENQWKQQEMYNREVRKQELEAAVNTLNPWQKNKLSKIVNSKGGNQGSSK
ncbi:hypothetical protein PGT21_018712 [Puccinia graminis f. sp. tritici]|uniref:Uncharacterized protein n=1 Tax=Puccinia graminis f. sp. tritici TaxID=56615 RepID=A0A5B0MF02_PUCGR|nr:hypothetical protein PGT21_018712 [Puccinia graminis f. sp. tritici]